MVSSSAKVNVDQALRSGTQLVSSQTAHADVMLLLAHATKKSRTWLVAHPEAPLSEREDAAFIELCRRRGTGEPVAYILNAAGFYGREFFVDEDVLVPRPETEHLVDEAIRFIKDRRQQRQPITVLEVGVGSGAIACTIAAETDAVVVGTDLSGAAIAVAKENARRLEVLDRCRFLAGDLAEPVRNDRFDVVVANLPYIPSADLPRLPDPVSFEPREALDGGPDGLIHYRKLLTQIPQLLTSNGLLLLEAAPATIEGLKNLTQRSLSNFAVSVGHDYAGLERYVRAAEHATKVESGGAAK